VAVPCGGLCPAQRPGSKAKDNSIGRRSPMSEIGGGFNWWTQRLAEIVELGFRSPVSFGVVR